MDLVNLTPHTIDVADADGNVYMSIGSSGVCRVLAAPSEQAFSLLIGNHSSVQVVPHAALGKVDGLPDRQDGVLYIVSMIAAQAIMAQHPERRDILYPGTGPADNCVRDDDGKIVAVRQFRCL